MSLRPLLTAITLSALALSASSAASAVMPDGPCWSQSELTAAHSHALKTMLMVGALKCRKLTPGAQSNYDHFIDDRQDMVAGHSYIVRGHFVGRMGLNKGAAAFDDYESRLGNFYSGLTPDNVTCARIDAYTRLALQASEVDLAALGGAVAALPETNCAAMAVAQKEPNVATMAEPVPAAPADVKLVQTAAAAEKTPASPSAADALAEAARALASAAVALQAQAKPTPQ